jgi:hypothetical protein
MSYTQCAKRPVSCGQDDAQACGCDGKIYPNACDAQMHGVDVAFADQCMGSPPPGTFACGGIFCKTAEEFCNAKVPAADGPYAYECDPLPACDAGSICDCINAKIACDFNQPSCDTTDGATTFTCIE